TDDDVDVAQSSFILGGLGKFSGFRENALAGQNYNLARAVYYRRLNPSSIPLTIPMYLGGTLEYGRIYNGGANDLDTRSMGAASLLLGMATGLGPPFQGTGPSGERDRARYINLGRSCWARPGSAAALQHRGRPHAGQHARLPRLIQFPGHRAHPRNVIL